MRVSIWPSLAQPWADVVEVTRHAEATGWDGVYVADHFMGDGGGFGAVDTPTLEGTAALAALGIVFRTKRGRYEVAVSQLGVGIGLLDLGFPTEAAIAAADVYAEHGRQLAKELNELFRTMVWPVYKESGASPDKLREVVERLKPLSIASLVSAYESAMDETRREAVEHRTR